MNPLLVIYLAMVSGMAGLMHQIDILHTLIGVLIGLQILDIALTHANLKTWLQKAKWGVGVVLRGLDRYLIALVDNREK